MMTRQKPNMTMAMMMVLMLLRSISSRMPYICSSCVATSSSSISRRVKVSSSASRPKKSKMRSLTRRPLASTTRPVTMSSPSMMLTISPRERHSSSTESSRSVSSAGRSAKKGRWCCR